MDKQTILELVNLMALTGLRSGLIKKDPECLSGKERLFFDENEMHSFIPGQMDCRDIDEDE